MPNSETRARGTMEGGGHPKIMGKIDTKEVLKKQKKREQLRAAEAHKDAIRRRLGPR